MVVYISGPMTGLPDDNKPAFRGAAQFLRNLGHSVISPAEIEVPVPTWEAYLREDIRQMMDADAVVVLPGWERSKGANLEVSIALALRMQLFKIEDFKAGELKG